MNVLSPSWLELHVSSSTPLEGRAALDVVAVVAEHQPHPLHLQYEQWLSRKTGEHQPKHPGALESSSCVEEQLAEDASPRWGELDARRVWISASASSTIRIPPSGRFAYAYRRAYRPVRIPPSGGGCGDI